MAARPRASGPHAGSRRTRLVAPASGSETYPARRECRGRRWRGLPPARPAPPVNTLPSVPRRCRLRALRGPLRAIPGLLGRCQFTKNREARPLLGQHRGDPLTKRGRRLPHMVPEEGMRRDEEGVDDDERPFGPGLQLAAKVQREHAPEAVTDHEVRTVSADLACKPRCPVVVGGKPFGPWPVEGHHVDA